MATPFFPCSIYRKLALSAGWAGVCLVGTTGVLALSHLSSSMLLSPTRTAGLPQAQQSGLAAGGLLLATLMLLLALAFTAPAYRGAARRVSMLSAGLLMTGLPLTLLSLALTTWVADSDFRDLGAIGGLVGFFLWVRAATECWRAALLPWQAAGLAGRGTKA